MSRSEPDPLPSVSPSNSTVRHQLPRFIVVGCAAAGTHLGVVLALMRWVAGLDPLQANVIGWLCAFWVSWAGHHHLTFAAAHADGAQRTRQSLWKFFLVSLAGFALNEAAYAVMLRWAGVRYDLALVLVLVGVAGATFFASRHWAFAGASDGAATGAGH